MSHSHLAHHPTLSSPAQEPEKGSRRSLRSFFLVWAGQLVSTLGSGLTSFALGLWVYQKTGSVTNFALVALSHVLPRLLLSPLAGPLVDRWDRRKVMLFSDLGSGMCTLCASGLLFSGRMELWQLYAITALSAGFNTFQVPAYSASIILLVPAKQLGRANGMIQLAQSAADLFTPLLAGFLVMAVQVWGVILIDFATFLFAVFTLVWVRFPKPGVMPRQDTHPRLRGLLQESVEGWRFIVTRPGFVALLGFFAIFNFIWGLVGALAAPLALSFTTPGGLGVLMTVAGGGMLAGSLAMSAWGGPQRRVVGLLAAELVSGLCFILMGLRPELALVGLGALVAHATIAMVAGSSWMLWQTRVPHAMQGRVFAAQQMISSSAAPLALLAAGPLVEKVFAPLLLPGGALAGSIGVIVGVGPGRGIGLMFVSMGLVKALVALAGLAYPRLRRLEKENPAVQEQDLES